jgi:hypothetical protein
METWPVSYAVEHRLFMEALATRHHVSVPSTYFALGFTVEGMLHLPALERVVTEMAARHDALRIQFARADHFDDGQFAVALEYFARRRIVLPGFYRQRVLERSTVAIRSRYVDPNRDSDEQVLTSLAQDECADIAAASGAVHVIAVSTPSPTKHYVLLVVSHLTVDGWSAGMLRREFIARFNSLARNQPSAIGPVSLQYPAYVNAEHQLLQSGKVDAAISYWTQQWSRAEGAIVSHRDLPFARSSQPGPPDIRVSRLHLDPTCANAIRTARSRQNISLYALFRSAMTVVLYRLMRRERIAFWANFSNRRIPGAQQMVGSCAHSHLVSVEANASMTCHELCRQVAAQLEEARQHEVLSVPALMQLTGRAVHAGDALVSFDMWPAPVGLVAGSRVHSGSLLGARSWIDCDVRLCDHATSLTLSAIYNARRYEGDGIAEMLADIECAAEQLARMPDRRLSECSNYHKRVEWVQMEAV